MPALRPPQPCCPGHTSPAQRLARGPPKKIKKLLTSIRWQSGHSVTGARIETAPAGAGRRRLGVEGAGWGWKVPGGGRCGWGWKVRLGVEGAGWGWKAPAGDRSRGRFRCRITRAATAAPGAIRGPRGATANGGGTARGRHRSGDQRGPREQAENASMHDRTGTKFVTCGGAMAGNHSSVTLVPVWRPGKGEYQFLYASH